MVTDFFRQLSTPLIYVFVYFTMPLSFLFRYHSTVCLADLFTKLYEDESERFECHIRLDGYFRNFSKKTMNSLSEISSMDSMLARTDPRMCHRNTIKSLHIAKKRIGLSEQMHSKLKNKLRLN